MANTEPARDSKGELIPREAVLYDPIVRGYDSSFWKTISGTPAISSSKLRLNAAEINSYAQFLYGKFAFAVNVPTTPSAGEAKIIGLKNQAGATLGAVYFEIAGAVFTAVSRDDSGTAQTTTLTWSGEGAEQVFQIEWEKDNIVFRLAGTVVACHKTRVGSLPLSLNLKNADADNTDTGYVMVKEAGRIIS